MSDRIDVYIAPKIMQPMAADVHLKQYFGKCDMVITSIHLPMHHRPIYNTVRAYSLTCSILYRLRYSDMEGFMQVLQNNDPG